MEELLFAYLFIFLGESVNGWVQGMKGLLALLILWYIK